MEPTITRFSMFLLSELVFVLVTAGVMIPLVLLVMRGSSIKGGHIIAMAVVGVFLTNTFLFFAVWILTAQNYLDLFAILTLVSIAAILIAEFLWIFVGTRDVPWAARSIWSGLEFAHVFPTVTKALKVAGMLLFLVYPIYIGIGYFGKQFGTAHWDLYVFQATLIVFVFVGWLTVLPQGLYLVTSKNIMEGTRSRMFLSQLAGTISILFYVSLLLWTLNLEGMRIAILGDQFILSSSLMYVMSGYVLAVVVIPYFIGHRRAQEWMSVLQKRRLEIVQKLSVSLLEPNVENIRRSLTEIVEEISSEKEKFESQKAVQYARAVEGSTSHADAFAKLALADAKKRDPRFIYVNALDELQNDIDKSLETIDKASNKEKVETAKNYAGLFSKKLEILKEDEGSKVRPPILVGIAIFALPVLNATMASVSKYMVKAMGLDVS